MGEDKFWGYADEGGMQFDYGRDVLMEDTYEKYLFNPYSEFKLYPSPATLKKEFNPSFDKLDPTIKCEILVEDNAGIIEDGGKDKDDDKDKYLDTEIA